MEGGDERQAGFMSIKEEAGAQGEETEATHNRTEAVCTQLGTAQLALCPLHMLSLLDGTTVVFNKYVLMTICLILFKKNF